MNMLFSQTKHEREVGKGEVNSDSLITTKEAGAFYTPLWLAKRAVKKILDANSYKTGKRIVDPSCGEGVFLIAFLEELKARKVKISGEVLVGIYGFDIDSNALSVAKKNVYNCLLNVGLSQSELSKCKKFIDKNFIRVDIYDLVDSEFELKGFNYSSFFDYVVGNPPWRISRKRADYDSNRNSWAFSRHKSDCELVDAKKNWKSSNEKLRDKDIYLTFLNASNNLLRSSGGISMILPDSFLRNTNSAEVRKEFVEGMYCDFEEYQNTGKAFDIDSRKKFLIATMNKLNINANKILHSSGNRASRSGTLDGISISKEIKIKDLLSWGKFGIVPDLKNEVENMLFHNIQCSKNLISSLFKPNKNIDTPKGALLRGANIELLSLNLSDQRTDEYYLYWRKISKDDNTRTLLSMISNKSMNYDKNSVHMVPLNEKDAIWAFVFMNSIFGDFYIKTQMTVNITREMLFNMPIPSLDSELMKVIFALVSERYFNKSAHYVKKAVGGNTFAFARSYSSYFKTCNDLEFFACVDYLMAISLGMEEEELFSFVESRFSSFTKKHPGYLSSLTSMLLLQPMAKEAA